MCERGWEEEGEGEEDNKTRARGEQVREGTAGRRGGFWFKSDKRCVCVVFRHTFSDWMPLKVLPERLKT